VRFAALLICLAALLAGCGSSVDTGEAEERTQELARDDLDIDVREVSCPDDPPSDEGDQFRCKVTADDGTTGDALVTVEGDGRAAIQVPFINTSNAERLITERLGKEEELDVDCPDIRMAKVGDRFTCDARFGGQPAEVEVTQRDASGSIGFRLVESRE
jgi:hypothetical protein